ncbi:MAG TPA: phage minor head protein [Ginsengibacter sp.]|nr:phage minor head protein [Ginsengibacter sp.]
MHPTARQSGHNAQFWEDIQANKGLYPNLKYKTQEDDRVREEHEKMDNIIPPVDDAFWNEFYPPNGWRCRCYAVQTAEDATLNDNMPQITVKDVKPEFRLNAGKSGQVFKEDSETGHRFFALAENDVNWPKRFELSKLDGGNNTVKTPKGNKVKVSIYAHEADLLSNLQSSRVVLDNVENVRIKI